MDEQQRVFRAAELLVAAGLVEQRLFGLESAFPPHGAVDEREHNEVSGDYHTQHDTPDAHFYPELHGGAVDLDDTVPEDDQLREEQHYPLGNGGRDRNAPADRRPDSDRRDTKAGYPGDEKREYLLRAVGEDAQPQRGVLLQLRENAVNYNVGEKRGVDQDVRRQRRSRETKQQRARDTQRDEQEMQNAYHHVGTSPEFFTQPVCGGSGNAVGVLREGYQPRDESHVSSCGMLKTVRMSSFPLSVRKILSYAALTAFSDAASS